MPVFFSKEEKEKLIKKTDRSYIQNDSNQSTVDKINDYLLKFSSVPLKEKLFFVQHLGVMLRAGISLSISIKTLAKQTPNKAFAKALETIGLDVERGKSFSDSLRKHDKIFGTLFTNMVEAGELSGKLEEVMKELFLQMKKEHKLISKVKGALTYPAVIIFAMLGISTFMMIVIVPQITSMFDELKAELPLPTKILMAISDALINHGPIVLTLFIISVIAFIKTIRTPKGKFYFQAILLKTPVIGSITKKINLARFARNVSSLLKTDIMIVQTFEITASVLGNLHYREAIIAMSQQIKKGDKIQDVMDNYPSLFTPLVAQMIAIGEETGELDTILVELAEFYEEEVDLIMENLPSIIEPLLILGLGVGIGGVAVAIIMPMYSLSTAM